MAQIRFPYCKKHWLAKITGADMQYKLKREFLDYEEDGNDIVYGDLDDGYYQLSRFGRTGEYLKIEDGEAADVGENEVLKHFNAPNKGKSEAEMEEYREDQRQPDSKYGIHY